MGIGAVTVPAGRAASYLKRYRSDSGVANVEVQRSRRAASVATDPSYGDQWALPKIGWEDVHGVVSPSGTATLAVLDTGVSSSADVTLVPGWSAFGGSPTHDQNGHGTALASIAAATTDNETGIAGVAYAGVSVIRVQVLGADGTGTDADVIAGLTWAVDNGADVVLMGFSDPGYSAALQTAVDDAWARGVVLVAATGNDGSSTPTYPAGDAHVVGAASNGVIVGRLARNADPAGTVAETGNGRVNLARAIADTTTDPVDPVGTDGAASGGPFVGPYTAAALGVDLSFLVSTSSLLAEITGGGEPNANKSYVYSFFAPGVLTTGTPAHVSPCLAAANASAYTYSLPPGYATGTWSVLINRYNDPGGVCTVSRKEAQDGTDTALAAVSIQGAVYRDTNGNGVLDTGEIGLAGVTVTRSGTGATTVTTNANGSTPSRGWRRRRTP